MRTLGESVVNQPSFNLTEQLHHLRKTAGRFKRWLIDRANAFRKTSLRAMALPAAILPGEPSEAIAFLNQQFEFNIERVILGYYAGMYPMGRRRGKIGWDDPPQRAVIPLDQFHTSRRLKRFIKKNPFEITYDKDFRGVVTACAEREVTWITPAIIDTFVELHQLGLSHSVEAWQDGELVGGAYGTSIGSLFIGESMFYRVDQASKVALVHLAQRLIDGGYTHIDCQLLSPFWYQFGARNIPREQFKQTLGRCIATPAAFEPPG